jgi:hypothetical protein
MIRAREVRVIASEGEQLGILTVRDAIAKAEELGLDGGPAGLPHHGLRQVQVRTEQEGQ